MRKQRPREENNNLSMPTPPAFVRRGVWTGILRTNASAHVRSVTVYYNKAPHRDRDIKCHNVSEMSTVNLN